MKETRTLNIYPVYRTRVIKTLSSGSQYLRTIVEATAEHLRLTAAPTTIEAPKSLNNFRPKVISKLSDVRTIAKNRRCYPRNELRLLDGGIF
jgi:hypothetical protein